MRYALFSDIHGNLTALEAALSDAAGQGIDKYLFLGDYVEDFPFPNEVAERIREIPNAAVIRGNKEDYLVDIHNTPPNKRIYEQMAPMYWNYNELSEDNLNYLMNLPKTQDIADEHGGVMHMVHISPIFYRSPKIAIFSSSDYSVKMKERPFTRDEYLSMTRKAVKDDERLIKELDLCTADIYAFGHNHLQWHMRYKDTLFVNPGSCGLQLDFNIETPYTIIESFPGKWTIEERRVAYDIPRAIISLRESTLYDAAPDWSDLTIEMAIKAEEKLSFFLGEVYTLAKQLGDTSNPVTNKTWRAACKARKKASVSYRADK